MGGGVRRGRRKGISEEGEVRRGKRLVATSGRGCGGGVGEVGRRRMVGTGKKVKLERERSEKGRKEEKRKTGRGRRGNRLHGHGTGDTGVITRPRGRSGSSECISPNSLCFAL